MLGAGDVYHVEIPGEKTDHFWILVTDIDKNGRIAYAMLTDARNLDFASTVLPKGTHAWGSFLLIKDTAVNAARSNLVDAVTVEKVLRVAGQFQGVAVPSFLSAVKEALRQAPETPYLVKIALD